MISAFVTVQNNSQGCWFVVQREFSEVGGRVNLQDVVSTPQPKEHPTEYADKKVAEAAAQQFAERHKLPPIPYGGGIVSVMPVGKTFFVPVFIQSNGDVTPTQAVATDFKKACEIAKSLGQEGRRVFFKEPTSV